MRLVADEQVLNAGKPNTEDPMMGSILIDGMIAMCACSPSEPEPSEKDLRKRLRAEAQAASKKTSKQSFTEIHEQMLAMNGLDPEETDGTGTQDQ